MQETKGVCFHCNSKGHVKKNCPKLTVPKRIHLSSPDGDTDDLALRTKGHVNGHEAIFRIDNGAPQSIISLNLVKKLG